MRNLGKFLAETSIWAVGSVLSAAAFLGISLWEHFHDRPIGAYWFCIVACILFCVGAYRSRDQEIRSLREFKKIIDDQWVRLKVARLNRTTTPFGNYGPSGFHPVEYAECVSITFLNDRTQGMPGKIAGGVLARVSYTDSNGRHFQQEGRWNDLDQPGLYDPRQSRNHLLQADFGTGTEHHLDIAAKFLDGCFAINNDSFGLGGVKRPERMLTGVTVEVTVQLLAQYVDQTFQFELRNPVNGILEIVSM